MAKRIFFITIMVFIFSCAKKDANKPVSRNYKYQQPYSYNKPTKKPVSLNQEQIKKDSSKIIVTDTIIENKVVNEEIIYVDSVGNKIQKSDSLKKTPKDKKFHWLSFISMNTFLIVWALFLGILLYFSIPTLPFLVSYASGVVISLLLGIILVAIPLYAFVEYTKVIDEVWGGGFSIGTLYAALLSYLTYISLNYVNLLYALVNSWMPIILLGAIVLVFFTYYFFKMIKKMKGVN